MSRWVAGAAEQALLKGLTEKLSKGHSRTDVVEQLDPGVDLRAETCNHTTFIQDTQDPPSWTPTRNANNMFYS